MLENPELVLLMAQRMLEEQRKNELLQQELRLAKPKLPECCTNARVHVHRVMISPLKVPIRMTISPSTGIRGYIPLSRPRARPCSSPCWTRSPDLILL
ncbi:hypothetical protein M5E87_17415 [Flavonifractor plautii]|nr:hypothetical protein M5E87_17415 [Flavonifractor plautii]